MSKTNIAERREFIRGAARYNDLVYILSKGKKLIDMEISHTSLLGIDRGKWGSNVDTDWDSSALAVAKKPVEKLVFIGEDGDVCTYVGGKSEKELISPQPAMIRNASTIEGYVYACGMHRQVYLRQNENDWVDISVPFSELVEQAGFEGIDGYSSSEIYAVGWNGEVWRFDGINWVNCLSPTSVILTTVCCAVNGEVYIAGKNGVLIKGRLDVWQVIEWEDEVTKDIWDLCWFNEKLYVATIDFLFILNGNSLVEVDFGNIEINSCYCLTTSEGVLWSIGHNQVLSFDGKTWTEYT